MSSSSPASAKAANPKPNAPGEVTVIDVHHYTNQLFKFTLARPQGFRFRSGEFIMLGLKGEDGKPLLRAYSVASPNWADSLEFYSIKVPDGPLTSRLQQIKPGDKVILGRKPVGTLVHDALSAGKRLYLFATGTGIAPFASLLRDPETYEKFEEVIVTHTCREVAELAYSRETVDGFLSHRDIGEIATGKLRLYQTTTREAFERMGRPTRLIDTGQLFNDLDLPPLGPDTDRVMICGSLEMTQALKSMMQERGFTEGSNADPREFVIEKAFVG